MYCCCVCAPRAALPHKLTGTRERPRWSARLCDDVRQRRRERRFPNANTHVRRTHTHIRGGVHILQHTDTYIHIYKYIYMYNACQHFTFLFKHHYPAYYEVTRACLRDLSARDHMHGIHQNVIHTHTHAEPHRNTVRMRRRDAVRTG